MFIQWTLDGEKAVRFSLWKKLVCKYNVAGNSFWERNIVLCEARRPHPPIQNPNRTTEPSCLEAMDLVFP